MSRSERYIAATEFQSVRALALPMMQTAMDLALLTGLRGRNRPKFIGGQGRNSTACANSRFYSIQRDGE
jgi:hypothetical protein